MTIYRVYLRNRETNEEPTERTVSYAFSYPYSVKLKEKYEEKIKYFEDCECWKKGEITIELEEILVRENGVNSEIDEDMINWQIRIFHHETRGW